MISTDKVSISASFSNLEDTLKVHDNIRLYIDMVMKNDKELILETVEPRTDRDERVYYFEFEFPINTSNKHLMNILKLIKGYRLDSILYK